MAQNVFGRGGGGDHSHPAAMRSEHSQDVALRTIIDGDDVMARVALQTVAALAVPHRLGPLVGLTAGDFLGEVHAFQTGPIESPRLELLDIEPPLRMVRDSAVRRSEIADVPGQPARIHPGNADQPIMFEPGIQRLRGAIVCRRGNRGAQDETAGSGRRSFDVFPVGSDIADMGEREGDDLPGVRRVGQDLLVAGDRSIETDFPDSRSRLRRHRGPKIPSRPRERARRCSRAVAASARACGLSCGQPQSAGPQEAARANSGPLRDN